MKSSFFYTKANQQSVILISLFDENLQSYKHKEANTVAEVKSYRLDNCMEFPFSCILSIKLLYMNYFEVATYLCSFLSKACL